MPAGFTVARHEPGIALVTFERPERLNAMTQAMKRDLVEFLTAAQLDDSIRVVVFTGTGRAFVAGDDLVDYHHDDPTTVPRIGGGHDTAIGTAEALRVYSQAVNQAIRALDKVTIAAINGPAIQTGLSLALACDLRIASSSARLGSATLRFALLPDEGGHWLLVQLLGVARAMEFLLRKRIVDAGEALAMGLVSEVCPPEELLGRALTLATEMADGPQVAMRLLKRAVYVASETDFAHACEDIALRTGITDHHPDAREGARSFREKRSPRFNAALEGRPAD